jgi:hypothetical protein
VATLSAVKVSLRQMANLAHSVHVEINLHLRRRARILLERKGT